MDVEKILGPVRLRHLDLLLSEEPNYAKAMSEVYGYTNNWITRKWDFLKKFKKAFVMVNQLRSIDPTKLELTEDCPITLPDNIDFISFQAMMELQAHLNNGFDESQPAKPIARTIAIACYQSHLKEKKYVSDGKTFEEFEEWILNQNYLHTFPVFTWITDSLAESAKNWNERFFSVEIEDPDWDQAGGNRMQQFNVLNSVKTICHDFNIPMDEAWQISYNMVQTNAYAAATQNHIQENMRRLKEARMKAQRGTS